MRSNGPLGMSRTPVASTTRAPGCPSANRRYQSRFAWVTKPSSVARQGTIAGTQVRLSRLTGPMAIGWKRSDREASSAPGQRASGMGCLIGLENFHIEFCQFTTTCLPGVRRQSEAATALWIYASAWLVALALNVQVTSSGYQPKARARLCGKLLQPAGF